MTDSPRTHRDVIDRWPSLGEFAADIGVAYGTAKQMRRRNSIPDAYRPAVVASAKRRKIGGVEFEVLTRIAPARKSFGRTARTLRRAS